MKSFSSSKSRIISRIFGELSTQVNYSITSRKSARSLLSALCSMPSALCPLPYAIEDQINQKDKTISYDYQILSTNSHVKGCPLFVLSEMDYNIHKSV